MEVSALLQRVEPDERADDGDADNVEEEDPIKDLDGLRNMVRLDDSSNRERPGDE